MKQNLQNGSEILDLITKIQEQLSSLDKKMDSLISRPLPESRPSPQPFFPKPAAVPVPSSGGQSDFQKRKVMYPAICADCKKECTVPFKPSGERPVYCQECFSRRKTTRSLKVESDKMPPETPLVQAVPEGKSKPPAKEKNKPVTTKKNVAKKKPVAKKKKSGK